MVIPDIDGKGNTLWSHPDLQWILSPMDERRTSRDRLLLRATEAAELLGIGRSTVYDLIARGRIPVVRLGRRAVRIHRQALEQLLEREAKKAATVGQ